MYMRVGLYQEGTRHAFLTGEIYHDPEGGSPRVRLIHCAPDVLTLVISPNVGNSLHHLW